MFLIGNFVLILFAKNLPIKMTDDLLSGDETRQENKLGELTTMLCIGDEDYIRNFDMYSFLPAFIGLLPTSKKLKTQAKKKEVIILAARAIGLVLNIVPHSCPVVISSGAVPVLIEQLKDKNLNSELAEDVLKCLDKISIENPQVLLKEKDFITSLIKSIEKLRLFSNGLVKPALSLIANLFRKLSPNNFNDIAPAIGTLGSLFDSNEEETDLVCQCFAYLLDKFAEDEKKVKEIISQGMISSSVARLNTASTSKNSIIKLLSKICFILPSSSIALCKEGVLKAIQGLLSPQDGIFNGEASLNGLIASDVLLNDTLYLLKNLLPPLSGQDVFIVNSEPEHKWFWEDDFHNFTEYDQIASSVMEKTFQSKQNNCQVTIMKKIYDIDLTKMQQYNKQSRLMRNVTRNPIPFSYKRGDIITPTLKDKNFQSIFKKQKTQYPIVYSTEIAKDWGKNTDVLKQLFTYLLDPLLQVSSSSVSMEVRQDASMILGRMFFLANEDALKLVNSNRIIGYLSKVLNTGRKDQVIVSHSFLIADILINFTKGQFEASLIREGFTQIVKDIINSRSQGNPENGKHMATLAERFLGSNLSKVKVDITEQEKKLASYCKALKEGQDADLNSLVQLFSGDMISKFQFTKSGFAEAMINYLTGKDYKEKAKKILNVFMSSPETFKTIINLLNFSLESLEQLEAVLIEGLGTTPDYNKLSQQINVVLKSKEKSLDLSSVAHTVEPLATVGALKEFLFKKLKVNVDISYQDQNLESHLSMLEVFNRKVKYPQIWTTTHTLMISKSTNKFSISPPEDIFIKNLQNSGVSTSHPSNAYFTLLRIFNHLNRYWKIYLSENYVKSDPIIPESEFINHQISSKLTYQLQTKDSLILGALGMFPSWIDGLIESCRFLFTFELRRLFFYVINFGCTKSLNTKHNSYGGSSETKIGRKNVNRFTVKRQGLLSQAQELLFSDGTSKSTIEIEFDNEPGIGIGPTLSFYSLVSQELQKKEHKLFLDSDTEKKSEYVLAPHGLFPSLVPDDEKEKTKVLNNWRFFGILVGKALEDNRLLDTQLNISFIKLLQGEKLRLDDFKSIDIYLYNHLKLINDLKEKKVNKTSEKTIKSDIGNLYLDFTYKGHDLVKGGSEKDVSYDNIELYVKEFLDYTTSKGINSQIEMFLNGLSSVLPLHRLKYFSKEELISLICGNDEKWDVNLLKENTIVEGYPSDSKQLLSFFEILVEMSPEEKRQFIEFSTGCTRLPIGGIKNLNPKLTIIKVQNREDKGDITLPSVNTCFHKFKLPEYSSKKVMLERIKSALKYGQGFTLT